MANTRIYPPDMINPDKPPGRTLPLHVGAKLIGFVMETPGGYHAYSRLGMYLCGRDTFELAALACKDSLLEYLLDSEEAAHLAMDPANMDAERLTLELVRRIDRADSETIEAFRTYLPGNYWQHYTTDMPEGELVEIVERNNRRLTPTDMSHIAPDILLDLLEYSHGLLKGSGELSKDELAMVLARLRSLHLGAGEYEI